MQSRILEGPNIKNHFIGKTLGCLLYEAAIKYKDRLWQVETRHNDPEFYSTMLMKARRLALQLQVWGVTASDVIVICSDHAFNAGVILAGVLFLGAKVANIDANLSHREIRILLGLTSPAFIFIEECYINLIEEAMKDAEFTTTIIVIGLSNKYECLADMFNPQPNEDNFELVNANPDDTVFLIFVKSSTGHARASCQTHTTFLHIVNRVLYSGLDCSSVLFFNSLYWLANLSLYFAASLVGGCRYYCTSNKSHNIMTYIEEYKIQSLYMTPYTTHRLTMETDEGHAKPNVSSVHVIYTGGHSMSYFQLLKIKSVFPRAVVIYFYDISELGPICYLYPEVDKHMTALNLGACGKLAANVSARIVTLDKNETAGPKTRGEIRVKSPSLMAKYYRDEDRTKIDSDGFIRTGDLGMYDQDGCFYIVGRTKELFKYMGWVIVPHVIEKIILDHSCVEEAVVFGIPGHTQESGEIPTAWVVLKHGCVITEDDLFKFVADKVSDAEKLRGGIVFKTELPKFNASVLIDEIRFEHMKHYKNK